MNIDNSLKKYCDVSHEYAISEVLKRCIFEMKIHDELFGANKYSFDDFEQDLYCPYIYIPKKNLKKYINKLKRLFVFQKIIKEINKHYFSVCLFSPIFKIYNVLNCF